MHIIFLVLLGIASVVGLAFIIERGLALRWNHVIPPAVESAAQNCRTPQDLPMMARVCEQHPSPISRLLLTAREHLDWPKADNVAALEVRARHEVVGLERGLVVLEIVVGIAPLLGLVGTIYGLILLFGSSGTGPGGLADSSRLAQGIAVALQATLMGLLTAIPSLVAWSYFNKKVETITVEMETICDEFIRRQYRGGSQSSS